VSWSRRTFMEWRSPRPTIYPTWTHKVNNIAFPSSGYRPRQMTSVICHYYHWACCHTSCVCKSALEPVCRLQESLKKEVVHHRPGHCRTRTNVSKTSNFTPSACSNLSTYWSIINWK
jgi:hypothetical protein